jgi:hypothetical protein
MKEQHKPRNLVPGELMTRNMKFRRAFAIQIVGRINSPSYDLSNSVSIRNIPCLYSGGMN